MSKRKEITAEEKLRIVEGCKGGRYSQRKAGEIVGVGASTIDRWIKRYESEGAAGLLPYEVNRKYSPELKTKAVLEYLRGNMSLPEVCKKYKIRAERQLRNWIKVYNAHGDFNSAKHSGGGSYMKKARSTTQEERLEIVKECLESGKNYGEIQRQLPAGAYMDTAVRGAWRGRLGRPAWKAEERPDASDGAGSCAD